MKNRFIPRKDEAKPMRIMAAAERLLTSRQFHEIEMDDIAKAARVSKGTLYLYFKDKEDLLRKTVTSGVDELCELIVSRVAADDATPCPAIASATAARRAGQALHGSGETLS